MNEHMPGSKIAERMLSRPEGATMSELIAATGGPQYNVLKRLEAKGYTIRKTKQGSATRYKTFAPESGHAVALSPKGQVLLPKDLREKAGLLPGAKLRATFENGKIVLSRGTHSIRDIIGILHRPGMRARTVEEMDEGIRRAVTERYLRSIGRKK